MSGIKTLLVFAVTSFNLAIVSGSKRPEQLVFSPMLHKSELKYGRLIRTPMGTESLGKLLPVVGLDTFKGAWKGFDELLQEQGGGIGTVLLKSLHKTPSGRFIKGSVLIKRMPFGFVYKADRRDKFDVDLEALTGRVPLFIRFWDILWVRWMNGHNPLFFQEALQPGNRT